MEKVSQVVSRKSLWKEPTLRELTKLITEEAQVENDQVYGRVGSRSHNSYNFKKTFPNLRAAGSKITTLATEVRAGKDVVGPELSDFPAVGQHPDGTCMVWKEGVHRVSGCAAFSSKNLNWRRRFARQNKLCYRCLSNDHLRGKCPEKKGCTRTECTDPTTITLFYILPR